MMFEGSRSRPVELWFFRLTVDGPLADGIGSFVGGERRAGLHFSKAGARFSLRSSAVSLAGRRAHSVPRFLFDNSSKEK